jgi:hypothetical protein
MSLSSSIKTTNKFKTNNKKENYLTRRGYAIFKENYELKTLDEIRNALKNLKKKETL